MPCTLDSLSLSLSLSLYSPRWLEGLNPGALKPKPTHTRNASNPLSLSLSLSLTHTHTHTHTHRLTVGVLSHAGNLPTLPHFIHINTQYTHIRHTYKARMCKHTHIRARARRLPCNLPWRYSLSHHHIHCHIIILIVTSSYYSIYMYYIHVLDLEIFIVTSSYSLSHHHRRYSL